MPYYRGICNFCGTGCGHLLRVEDNRVRGVYPLPGHPLSRGRLCVRGWHIHELLQTEDRIITCRVKEKNSWKEVKLEEAIGYLAEKLSRYSGWEVGFLGSPRSSNEDNYLFGKFARAVMKSNLLSLTSDAGQEESTLVLLEGTGWPAALGSLERLRQADYILVVGGDLTRQNPIVASEIHYAARVGARLVTISPRETQMARLSRLHLRPRPGTTRLLLQALSRMLLDEGLIEEDYLRNHTKNHGDFLAAIAAVEPEQIEVATGIELRVLREEARRLSEARSAYAFYPTGIQSLDRNTIAAIFNLFLLAGKVGKPGCGINPVTGISNLLGSYDMGLSPLLLPGYSPISDEASLQRLEKLWGCRLNLEPGKSVSESLAQNTRMRALLVVDHDEEIIRNLKKIENLELVVYFGAYENPFARLADVVFPLTTYAEADGTYTNSERRVQLNEKKVEPSGEAQPLWQIMTLLAGAMGHRWNYSSAAEVMAEISQVVPQYSGITYDKLRIRPGLKWPCDQDHPEGTDCLLIDELSRPLKFVLESEPVQTREVLKAEEGYPFKLVVGRSNYFWHQNSIMKKTFIPRREYNALLLLYPGGFVEISSEDARKLNLREKQSVRILATNAELRLAVRISDDVCPGMLYVPYFVEEMIPEFLHRQVSDLEKNEEFYLPVRLEKVE